MASPSPSPPYGRVDPGFFLAEPIEDIRQKRCDRSRRRCRRRRAACGSRSRFATSRTDTVPRSVNFTALDTRFPTTCCKRTASPKKTQPCRSTLDLELESLGGCGGGEDRGRVLNDLAEIHKRGFDSKLAGQDA